MSNTRAGHSFKLYLDSWKQEPNEHIDAIYMIELGNITLVNMHNILLEIFYVQLNYAKKLPSICREI